MTRRIVAGVLAGLVSGGVGFVSAQEGPPQRGPEHEKMDYFVGTWSFKGEAKPGPMGPGGAITFTETCELFEGGFALICRSEGKGPMGPTKSLSVMTYDSDRKAYTYTGVESHLPVFVATGQLEAGTWSWKTEGKMGGQPYVTKVTVTESGKNAYGFRMDVSAGGAPFVQVMDGKATR